MDFRSRKRPLIVGAAVLAAAIGGLLVHGRTNQPSAPKAELADAAPMPPVQSVPDQPPPTNEPPTLTCMRKGIAVTLGQASFKVSGPPALTLVTGGGVDDDIDFSTKEGIAKACAFPSVTAKAMAMNFDAMDKKWGAAVDWRAAFCGDNADAATRFLCQGEDRAEGVPRRLAAAALYDPKAFDGEALFQQKAPTLANFSAWKDNLTKADTPPPVQADGAFDVYPGGVWLERDPASGSPLIFSCDVDTWPVTGQHYCIGSLDLDQGLHARLEFRTVTGQVGAEAADAEAQLRALLAAWH
jgi:hypothetical protein